MFILAFLSRGHWAGRQESDQINIWKPVKTLLLNSKIGSIFGDHAVHLTVANKRKKEDQTFGKAWNL